MTPKEMLTNKAFCPIPWTGFYVDTSGAVKNCICSYETIGNLKDDSIQAILHGEKNTATKTQILAKQEPNTCGYCYSLEKDKRSFDIVSSRVYYLKELKKVDPELYKRADAFDLHHVDVRWSNTCNHACVYCDHVLSSKWASELNLYVEQPSDARKQELKDYIFSNVHQLKNVYMAGGEPLLMRENEEFLQLRLEKKPDGTVRVDTNLSKTETRILDLLCQFKNVHWTVSAESMREEFEYMRYGGVWSNFLNNLEKIRQLPHKITFNMVWTILNAQSMFTTVDYFRDQGFGPNAFILTAVKWPGHFDTRHLPESQLQSIKQILESRIKERPGFLLEDGYRNLLTHIEQPFEKNLSNTFKELAVLDSRRNLDSSRIFKDLYKENYHGN